MSKKCPNCGASIPEDASFCPHCTTNLIEKQTINPPKPRRKTAFIVAAVTVILVVAIILAAAITAQNGEDSAEATTQTSTTSAATTTASSQTTTATATPAATVTTAATPTTSAAATTSATTKATTTVYVPKVFDEDGPSVKYVDEGGEYELLVAYHPSEIAARQPQEIKQFSSARDGVGGFPTVLGIYQDQKLIEEEDFFSKVESCTVESFPDEGSVALDIRQPEYNSDYQPSLRDARLEYTGTSGNNNIVWTIKMKNGDTIRMHQRVEITPLDRQQFSPETTKLDTIEDIQQLLEAIELTVNPSVPIDIYLPPYTYEGDLEISGHSVSLYGGSNGPNRTTFTGNLTITSDLPEICTVQGILFEGNGGTAVQVKDASAFLVRCQFLGWDTAVSVLDRGMVFSDECTYEGNGIAITYNVPHILGFASNIPNNRFINNKVALQILALDETIPLELADCVFSGNETDIDNPIDYPLVTDTATFE